MTVLRQQFIELLQSRGLSRHTQTTYVRAVRHLAAGVLDVPDGGGCGHGYFCMGGGHPWYIAGRKTYVVVSGTVAVTGLVISPTEPSSGTSWSL